MTLTNRITWQTVDNAVNEKTMNGSLVHALKSGKKIKRRTRALNIELKRFSSLKSYSRYVKTKTAILRNITDNEDTDEDSDMYSVKMEFSREPSLSPSSLTNYISRGSRNLASMQDGDSVFLPRKSNRETRKMNKSETNLTEPFGARNCQEKKEESIQEKNMVRTKYVSSPSGIKDSTQEKGLRNAKRNLTFLLENLADDTNRAYISQTISPIEQSTKIHYKDSNNYAYDDIESFGAVIDDYKVNANTALVANKVVEDCDVDNKQITRLDEVAEEKEEELKEQPALDGTLTKRSQPVITSTEIVKAKYTIVRDEVETDSASHVESSVLENSQLSLGNTFLTDKEATEVNEISPESRRIGQLKRINLISNSSDSEECQDNEDDDHGVNFEKNVVSSDSTRIDESEESHGEIVDLQTLPTSSSQMISDPSDSDESVANPDETNSGEDLANRANNHPSSLFSIISDSKASTCTARTNENRISDKASLHKSIRCQIREQENLKSSTVLEKIEEAEDEKERKKKNRTSNFGTEEDNVSLTGSDKINVNKGGDINKNNVRTINNDVITNYLSNNLARRVDYSSECEMGNCITSRSGEKNEERGGSGDRNYSRQRSGVTSTRPIELCEFIYREGLVANQELSTITAKDFNECAQKNGDEDVWLMEIPRSIISNVDELCGKNMAFERGNITINDVIYKTTCRDEKLVSCIVRSGKKKSRYKTVNVEPVGCIVVRQRSSDKTAPSPSNAILPIVQTDAAVRQFRSIVPFPKNLKSRDPLNSLNGIEDFSTAEDTRETLELKETRKRKGNLNQVTNKSRKILKKTIRKFWHVDNFTLNRKE